MGQESGNDDAADDDAADVADLPLLQDDADARVWERWGVTWRDVVILDGDNAVVDVYNLTDHDLGDPDNLATLEALLVHAAEAGLQGEDSAR